MKIFFSDEEIKRIKQIAKCGCNCFGSESCPIYTLMAGDCFGAKQVASSVLNKLNKDYNEVKIKSGDLF